MPCAYEWIWLVLHGVFVGPFARRLIVLLPLLPKDHGDLWHQGVVGIWVGEQRADTEKHLKIVFKKKSFLP